MKKLLSLFLVLFVTFTLALSIISTKEVKANEHQSCVGWLMIESRVHATWQCFCHGNSITAVDCETSFGCGQTCTEYFCD
jgi:hypothetical protein